MLRIGTVAWTIPKPLRSLFEPAGSSLERYATRFNAVEIDSTFYRLPRRATIERWVSSVPTSFQFAVKMPQAITHEAGLRGVRRELREFVELMHAFGDKLGPLLIQLAPSLELEPKSCNEFFKRLRALHDGAIVFEPRHPSFFERRATELLLRHRITRVAADPPRCPGANLPAGEPGLVYFRLHGSPRIYYDVYSSAFVASLAKTITELLQRSVDVWCIFDNTALGGATHNALELQRCLPSC